MPHLAADPLLITDADIRAFRAAAWQLHYKLTATGLPTDAAHAFTRALLASTVREYVDVMRP